MAQKTVALLLGGWSSERDVSLMKSPAVADALRQSGYKVVEIDVTRDLKKVMAAIEAAKPDVIFNNLYGRGGEDGTIQGVLDIIGIPYTHSGVLASALGMDKPLVRKLATAIGVRVAEGRVAHKDEVIAESVMPRPYVIKPVNEGSSVGVQVIFDGENTPPLSDKSWEFGDEVLVEKYVPGREVHVAVLDGVAQATAEIVTSHRFYDYEAKYHDTTTKNVVPADIPEDIAKTAKSYAEKIYSALGCRGLARCDLRWDDRKGADGVHFLEINTQPGLTAESCAPLQVMYNKGINFAQTCALLVESALCQDKQNLKDGNPENKATAGEAVTSDTTPAHARAG